MKITYFYTLLSILVLPVVTSSTTLSYSIIPCTIAFPASVASVPTIRVYHEGEIKSCSIDQDEKTITFTIPKYSHQTQFHVLITEKIDFSSYTSKWDTKENNTAACITLKKGQQYLWYTLTLNESTQTWHIHKVSNDGSTHIIPDSAIIICMAPNWIESMMGDNAFELPRINIKKNVCELSGSEKAFYEQAVRLQIAALDSDTLHGTAAKQITKRDTNRIMIAAPTV